MQENKDVPLTVSLTFDFFPSLPHSRYISLPLGLPLSLSPFLFLPFSLPPSHSRSLRQRCICHVAVVQGKNSLSGEPWLAAPHTRHAQKRFTFHTSLHSDNRNYVTYSFTRSLKYMEYLGNIRRSSRNEPCVLLWKLSGQYYYRWFGHFWSDVSNYIHINFRFSHFYIIYWWYKDKLFSM